MSKQLTDAREKPTSGGRPRRSACPVACTLDLVGDRWTLLIVRDLQHGKRRYGEFLESPEGIPTNILADRLRRLEREGIVERVLYHEHPPRAEYQLTGRGADLGPIVDALYAWGLANLPCVRDAYPRTKPSDSDDSRISRDPTSSPGS